MIITRKRSYDDKTHLHSNKLTTRSKRTNKLQYSAAAFMLRRVGAYCSHLSYTCFVCVYIRWVRCLNILQPVHLQYFFQFYCDGQFLANVKLLNRPAYTVHRRCMM